MLNIRLRLAAVEMIKYGIFRCMDLGVMIQGSRLTFMRPSRYESRALSRSPIPKAFGKFRLAPFEPDNMS